MFQLSGVHRTTPGQYPTIMDSLDMAVFIQRFRILWILLGLGVVHPLSRDCLGFKVTVDEGHQNHSVSSPAVLNPKTQKP